MKTYSCSKNGHPRQTTSDCFSLLKQLEDTTLSLVSVWFRKWQCKVHLSFDYSCSAKQLSVTSLGLRTTVSFSVGKNCDNWKKWWNTKKKKKRNLMTKDRIQLTPSALETYLAGVAIS